MENCSESVEEQTLHGDPVMDVTPDLTEDLNKQLEDIISLYQATEKPAENEELEEEVVTGIKESGKAKDPRLEKKMMKGLGEALVLARKVHIVCLAMLLQYKLLINHDREV